MLFSLVDLYPSSIWDNLVYGKLSDAQKAEQLAIANDTIDTAAAGDTALADAQKAQAAKDLGAVFAQADKAAADNIAKLEGYAKWVLLLIVAYFILESVFKLNAILKAR